MIPVLSLVTSIKDYLEVVHKLIEYDSSNLNINYSELGTIITYFILSLKNCLFDFLSFSWLKNIWSLPILIPDISSAMISEISVLDGYFHNAFNFLDTPISYGEQNTYLLGLEKFTIGVLNSLFLCLPTSTAHIITLRRFVMQGLEAGFISGLGIIAGNMLWLASVILGWRFFVIPWLSNDIFRYLLGFILLVKYMWDSYNERKTVLEDLSKQKIFVLTFLLTLTEQTSIYPFISNLSFSPEASILESFPADNYTQFMFIHICYLLGIGLGSFSLLNFTCWFWENPAFKLYMWMISSFKVSTSVYYRALSLVFLYLTMISAIASVPYYGLDYTITNPLGYVNDDRLIQDKVVLETSFLGSKASDRNTRRNRGRHGRRERWKRRIRKYRTFDASLYDQGIYDLFTIEDLNYGFDRFWLRRKLRNHRVRFRFFPGPWMRSFKKQLAKPRLESYTGPRVEFFRILFEQVYHPSFHAYETKQTGKSWTSFLKGDGDKNQKSNDSLMLSTNAGMNFSSVTNFTQMLNRSPEQFSIYNFGAYKNQTGSSESYIIKNDWRSQNSTLRKFVRKLDNRLKTAQIVSSLKNETTNSTSSTSLYSKRWKHLFSKMYRDQLGSPLNPSSFVNQEKILLQRNLSYAAFGGLPLTTEDSVKKLNVRKNISKKDLQVLRYRSLLNVQNSYNDSKQSAAFAANGNQSIQNQTTSPSSFSYSGVLLHPLKFYLQKQKGFERKLRYYTPNVFRKFSVENNAPYFRVMMRNYFYNYKPTSRWERTMKVASLRKARRKTTRIPRKLSPPSILASSGAVDSTLLTKTNEQQMSLAGGSSPETITILNNRLVKPTNNYSVVSKRANRYRYQIYKDVLQHWYYSPFNRVLMKMDVDSFIRRQPNAHFLTPKEENLLHLRRFLLSEHYNTLRWYTNMEHYRSMKTRLNGTKSFSSQAYNQQFAGTFKKIRHLFAITPSQGNVVLKFDQPLYNEYSNTSSNPLLNSMIIHEELLTDSTNNSTFTNKSNGDLLTQSQETVRNYLIQTRSARENYIKDLLNQNNYTELTQFLYKGGKTRGDGPVTNQRLFNNQEKDLLLTPSEKRELDEQIKSSSTNPSSTKIREFLNNKSFMEDLYMTYLFKWKRRINDQEALKNYLTHRIEKREKRKQRKEKNLLNKLKRLQMLDELSPLGLKGSAASLGSQGALASSSSLTSAANSNELLTSGLQKSILDGMYTLKNVDVKTTSGYEKSLWKVLLLAKLENNKTKNLVLAKDAVKKQSQTFADLKQSQKQRLSSSIQTSASELKIVLQQFKKSQSFATGSSIQLKSLSAKVTTVYTKLKKNLSSFLGVNNLTNLFKPIKRKSLQAWRKKERAMGKQKRSRKDFKLLNKKAELAPAYTTLSSTDRNEMNLSLISATSRKKRTEESVSFNSLVNSSGEVKTSNTGFGFMSNISFDLPSLRNFKRKRSPQRRSRVRRNRGVFKKRTLNDTVKKDIKAFYNADSLSLENKNAFYEKMNLLASTDSQGKLGENASALFEQKELKQRKSKQRKQRYWKQKRSKYSQKRRKYRKRRRYAFGKIRVLSKQMKRVKNKLEIQNWWWKKFMPSVQASTDALWQIEKDQLIQQKLSQLSSAEIIERDRLTSSSVLQIGDKDFKPNALPQAMRLNSENQKVLPYDVTTQSGLVSTDKTDSSNFQMMNQLYENLFINNSSTSAASISNSSVNSSNLNMKEFMLPTTNLPFYAGWDESLRKFIVTNRMLSRLDAGYQMKQLDPTTQIPGLKPLMSANGALGSQNSADNKFETNSLEKLPSNFSGVEFTQAPLQGMNAATTLYWQIPFTTYDPDQFFALGMDGFSPIGWRKFMFRHSILKSWLNTISSNSQNSSNSSSTQSSTLIVKSQKQIQDLTTPLVNKELSSNALLKSTPALSTLLTVATKKDEKFSRFVKERTVDAKNVSRRLKKRYRRVKKHPRTPVWFPSGPLLNQVLPVHYIYVFYKRSRLPRDRYLKRRLLTKQKLMDSEAFQKLKSSNPEYASYDFSLRKRLKPKRKYHLKRDFYSSNLVIPRRFKFISSMEDTTGIYQSSDLFRVRPLSSKKINKPIAELVKEQKLMRVKQRRKEMSSKQQTPLLRVKQLRRRVQRQILRSVWRYRPRAGGFVWPGDYLKFELVKAPKLKEKGFVPNVATDKDSAVKRKAKRKKKRNLVEWQIQPKKYLYQKHNLKVLKKKLEKAQRTDKIQQKVKELSYKF